MVDPHWGPVAKKPAPAGPRKRWTVRILKVIGLVIPLRATASDEGEGLDVTNHGEEAYMHVGGSAPIMREKGAVKPGSLSPARADA